MMEDVKENLTREEIGEVSSGFNAQFPPLANKDDTAVESIKKQVAKADREYQRVKTELANESLKLQRLAEQRRTSQALSDPNAGSIDSMFSVDSSALYLYKETTSCCFDATSHACTSHRTPSSLPCRHELCARARSSGISWTELDTLKWYDMRIRQERTPRMRSALAKQREVELARLKQFEDEENARYARKRNKAQNDTSNKHMENMLGSRSSECPDIQVLQTMIFEARISMMHVHKYNVFVGARQQAMADVAKHSNVVSMVQLHKAIHGSNDETPEEQLQKAHFKSQRAKKDAEWYEEKIAEAVSGSTIVADWQDFNLNLDLDFDGADADVTELSTLVNELLTDLGMPVDEINDIDRAQSALRHIMSLPAKKKSLKVQIALDSIQKVICKVQKRPKRARLLSPSPSYTPISSSSGDLRNSLMSLLHDELADVEHFSPTYLELVRIEEDAKNEINQAYQLLFQSPSELAQSLARIEAQAIAKSPVPKITQILLDILVSTHNDMSKGHAIIRELDQIDSQTLVAKVSGMIFARAEKKAEWLTQAFTAIKAAFEIAHREGPLPDRIRHALQRVKTSVEARKQTSQKTTVSSKKLEDGTLQNSKMQTLLLQEQTSAQNASGLVFEPSSNVAIGNDMLFRAHEKSIMNMSEFYSAETASMYTTHLFRHKYCPGCASLRIAQLVAALLVSSPTQTNQTIAALAAGHPVNTGEKSCNEGQEEFSSIDTWRRHVCHSVQCIVEIHDMFASLIKPSFSPEDDATFIGNSIVKILGSILLDKNPEEVFMQLLNMDWDSGQFLSLGWLLEKASHDETFYCAVSGNSCSHRASLLSPKEARVSEADTSNPSARGVPQVDLKASTNAAGASINATPVMTVSIVPGSARRKLLRRGERHQNHYNAMKAAAKVASMSTSTAKKMSNFFGVQQKAYEQARLALPIDVLDCMEKIRRIAYLKPSTPSQSDHDCQCHSYSCVAAGLKSSERTSKFVEDLPEMDRNGFEVTINGRAITDDELLRYTDATVERIRSIGDGEAQLEYICWVAHKISLEADAAQAAGKKWTLPVKRFEEFFTHYAPMTRSLELALDYAKGHLWLGPECLESYPTAEWSIIIDILTIMGKIDAKELTFASDSDGAWCSPTSMISASEGANSYNIAKEYVQKQETDVSAAIDQMFNDPVKFDRLMEGWYKRLLAGGDSDVSGVEATVEQVRKLFREGNIKVCKQLVLAGVLRVQSAEEVQNASVAVAGDTDLVPLPLNVRKDWLDDVVGVDVLGEATDKAQDLSQSHINISEQGLQQEQIRLERLQFEKEQRQAQAIQAQLETIRKLDDTTKTPPETPSVTERSVWQLFRTYEASAYPIIDYLATLSKEDWKPEEDVNIRIAARIQLQAFDCIRMLQLMAENRGWHQTATDMKQHIEVYEDLQEDEEGHYPDFWAGEEIASLGGGEELLASADTAGQES